MACDESCKLWLGYSAFSVAVTCALIACVISFVQIYRHMRNYTAPRIQNKMIGILFMVPIYQILSCLALKFQGGAEYIEIIRDTYECYILHIFLQLLICYICLQDEHFVEDKMFDILMVSKRTIPHVWPMNKCLKPWIITDSRVARRFINYCRAGTLQFLIMKPLSTIILIITHPSEGEEEESSPFMETLLFISTTISLYYLGKYNRKAKPLEMMSPTHVFVPLGWFYTIFKAELKAFNPVGKFLCVKSLLFFTYWQRLLLRIFRKQINHFFQTEGTAIPLFIENVVICIEVVFIAWAACHYYSYKDFEDTTNGRNKISAKLLGNVLLGNFKEVVHEFNEVSPYTLPTNFKPRLIAKEDFSELGMIKEDV